ncbi:MAG: 6-carboxytetrahydropterin synthase [Flavobacteriales bacterium]|nr:6-carboxytetrahydropterin synthase [Flavobacteriales bacterium]MCB9447040.1 6-carboxytetrahydropterin synthase [Flavobacteriales bacterium]
MMHITRRETFNAAHRLFLPELNDAENMEIFGKCSNPNWHGHNYVLYVTVKGAIDPKTGFVVNLKTLSQLIRKQVIEHLDHKNVNLDVAFMKGIMPSTENLAKAIWNQLEHGIAELGCRLHCIRLHETENNFVEYFGV